jgi:hypothetical protein
MSLLRSLSSILLALLGAAPITACPLCDTGTGRQVRAGIFDGSFAHNLVVTLLPFPVFLAIAAALYYGFPRRKGPGSSSVKE